MKNYKLLFLFVALLMVSGLAAQDDLYYNPAKDKIVVDDYKSKNTTRTNDAYTSTSQRDEADYDDEAYEYDEDYDYYYSSRIRRFQRPYYGFNFYDPVYVDMAYYDPFFSPFNTMLIYDNAFAFGGLGIGRWNRWNRWNNWGWNDPWGWNNFGGFNAWAWDPWNRWNGFGFNNFGFNNFGFGGGGFYCPPTWGNNYGYNTPRDIATNTYYGPRRAGSSRIPQANDGSIRREGPKDVTNTPRQGEGVAIPGSRTPSDAVTPRDSEPSSSSRVRAQQERRRSTETDPSIVTPRTRTPRESDQTRTRTYDQPRQSTPERQRSSGWDNSGSSRSSSPRMDNSGSRSSSSGSSSAPRSSGSSRRGGN